MKSNYLGLLVILLAFFLITTTLAAKGYVRHNETIGFKVSGNNAHPLELWSLSDVFTIQSTNGSDLNIAPAGTLNLYPNGQTTVGISVEKVGTDAWLVPKGSESIGFGKNTNTSNSSSNYGILGSTDTYAYLGLFTDSASEYGFMAKYNDAATGHSRHGLTIGNVGDGNISLLTSGEGDIIIIPQKGQTVIYKDLEVKGDINISSGYQLNLDGNSLSNTGNNLKIDSQASLLIQPNGDTSHNFNLSSDLSHLYLGTTEESDMHVNPAGNFEVYPNIASTNPTGTYGIGIRVNTTIPYFLSKNIDIMRFGTSASPSNPFTHMQHTATLGTFRLYTDAGTEIGALTKYDSTNAGVVKSLLHITNTVGAIALSPGKDVILQADLNPLADSTYSIGNSTLSFKDITVGNIRLKPQSSPPASPTLGTYYTDDSIANCWYNSTGWEKTAGSGTCA